MEKISSWSRLKKIIAWLLRYKNILRNQSQHSNTNKTIKLQFDDSIIMPLSISEVNEAENEIMKYVQKQTFKDELASLSGVQKTLRERQTRTALRRTAAFTS